MCVALSRKSVKAHLSEIQKGGTHRAVQIIAGETPAIQVRVVAAT